MIGFQSFSEYVYPGRVPFDGSMIEAKEDVITWVRVSPGFRSGENPYRRTTRLTVGACFFADSRIPVVPMIAGSSRSFLLSVVLKWNGDAVWTMVWKGGFDWTALSNASRLAMSSTMTKSSLSLETLG